MITNHHIIILFEKTIDAGGKIPVNTKMKTLITNLKNDKITIQGVP